MPNLNISAPVARQLRLRGYTFIELIITIAILAIVSTYGISQFREMGDKRQLKGALMMLFQDLRFARSEAIKMNKTVYAKVTPGKNWCYAITTRKDCNCSTKPDACVIEYSTGNISMLRDSDQYPGVTLSSTTSGSFSFKPIRSTATPGHVKIASPGSVTGRVVVSGLGRTRICSKSVLGKERYGLVSC